MTGNGGNRVGVLGIGLMGTAMAHRLLDQGFSVIAWDRRPEHVQALAERGLMSPVRRARWSPAPTW